MRFGASSTGARDRDAWSASFPFWDLYFGLAFAITVTAVALAREPGPRLSASVLLLVALAVAYAAFGRRAVRSPADSVPGAGPYAVVVILLFVSATTAEPAAATALSALTPQMFMIFRPVRAVAVVAVLFAAPTAGILRESGLDPATVVLTTAVLVACAGLMGVFIDRVTRQNAERAELIAELDRTRAELAEAGRETGMRAERERLSRDIHDTLAQGFTSIGMLLQAAEGELGANRYLELASRTAKENLAETRALVAALAPPALSGVSLGEALARLADGFPLPVELTVSGEPRPLGSTIEVTLLRVAQEGLANVGKHAGASAVRMALGYEEDAVRLLLADDGRGLVGGPAQGGGFGLPGMRTRVAQAGGTLEIEGAPGAGVTLTVELPCSG